MSGLFIHRALKAARWKIALWNRNTIEPAMLRAPIVIIVFIFLWGLTLWMMEKSRIQYHSVIAIRSAPIAFAYSSACFLAILYALDITMITTGMHLSVETGVSVFYLLVVAVCFMPNIPGGDGRRHFVRLMKNVFMPVGSVAFVEVLLADALTSVSKIFKDVGVTLVAIYAQFSNTNIIEYHDHGMILVALLFSLPYWIRVRQCWVQFQGASDNLSRIPITLNILKYMSAFPPIWLTAAASLGYSRPHLSDLITFLAVINSGYSFAWDIAMDWGLLSCNKDGSLYVRHRTLLPLPLYAIVTVINLLLRFSWAANRITFFESLHPSMLVLVIELGEVLRRSIWFIFRIEWEVISIAERQANKNDSETLLVKK